jgi:hypothetical protein
MEGGQRFIAADRDPSTTISQCSGRVRAPPRGLWTLPGLMSALRRVHNTGED